MNGVSSYQMPLRIGTESSPLGCEHASPGATLPILNDRTPWGMKNRIVMAFALPPMSATIGSLADPATETSYSGIADPSPENEMYFVRM